MAVYSNFEGTSQSQITIGKKTSTNAKEIHAYNTNKGVLKFEDNQWSFSNDGTNFTYMSCSSIIKGSVNTYNDLPSANLHTNEMYYVKTGSGGFLTFYKYPAGFYMSDGTNWSKAEIQTKISEDTTSLINITNWAEYIDANPTVSSGDLVLYSNYLYRNVTGTYTNTSPDADSTNWAYIDSMRFNLNNLNTAMEGEIKWNSVDKTFDMGLANGVVLQAGQEETTYVYNNTGTMIENGQVVYVSNVCNLGTEYRECVELAIADNRNIAMRTIGIANQNIMPGEKGYITKRGRVRGLNTNSYSTGTILYVSTHNAGYLQTSRPTYGYFPIMVAMVVKQDLSNGELYVFDSKYDDPDDIQNATGFPAQNKIPQDFTTSFVNATRTFTITPSGTEYYFYQLGVQYRKKTADSIVISDVEGSHYIYFSAGSLYEVVNPTDGQIDTLIRQEVIVRIIYWDSTNKKEIINGRENHGYIMTSDEHAYNHFTRGAQYISGLALSDILVDQNGSLNTHAQFGITSGTTADEDLVNIIPSRLSTLGFPIYALSGATSNLRLYSQPGYSVLTDITAGVGATGRLVYNQFTGGAWQLTTCTDNTYVLCHIFTNNDDTRNNLMAFIGINNYSTAANARTGANTEISTILSRFPRAELVPIGTVIFQTRKSYTNSVKARILSTDVGGTYIDWRTSSLKAGQSPADHNALSGLQIAGTGITYGHLNDQLQTLTGDKIFTTDSTSTPITSQAFNNNASAGGLSFRRGRGTIASPTQTQTDDVLGAFYFAGTTDTAVATGNIIAIRGMAAENHTTTNQGSYLEFFTTPIGGTGRLKRLNIASRGAMVHTMDGDSADGISTQNTNNGTLAETRLSVFQRSASTGISISMPSDANTSASLFGISRPLGAFIFNNSNRTMAIGTINANDLILGTSNAERMRIMSTGDIGIGTNSAQRFVDIQKSTSSGNDLIVPTVRVMNTLVTQGNGTSTFNFSTFETQSGNGTVKATFGTSYASDSVYGSCGYINVVTNHGFQIKTNNTTQFTINSSGTIISTQTYNNTVATSANMFVQNDGQFCRATSSIKYKKDVIDLGNQSKNIYKMRPVEYKSKSINDNPDWTYYGLIAEELALIEPRLVHYNGTDPDGVQYDRIVVLLIKELQELNNRVKELEVKNGI